jgi:hypothetical protein
MALVAATSECSPISLSEGGRHVDNIEVFRRVRGFPLRESRA